jgi:2'-5' RNA ligase
MALLLVAYPRVSMRDDEWLATLRLRYPGLTPGSLGPHFTLVFPISGADEQQIAEHIREQVRGLSAIRFVLRCALPVADYASEEYFVFLVPDEGFSGIVKLHDRLYTGPLATHLRHDIPFTPHITVGHTSDALLCRRVADELNAEDFAVAGSVAHLDLIEKNGDSIRRVESFQLGQPG